MVTYPEPLDDLRAVLEMLGEVRSNGDFTRNTKLWGRMYCHTCGGSRRMRVHVLFHPWLGVAIQYRDLAKNAPALMLYFCVECDALYTATIFPSKAGEELAVFASDYGGLATPSTPVGVRYCLDQADRAHSVSAKSGAVAMYRAALEHLLFEQGFEVRTLGAKLDKLRDAIADGTAPEWALKLDPDVMRQINRLGNFSIHPNDGDVSKQQQLTDEVLRTIKETFRYLLTIIYEEKAKREALLTSLKSIARPPATARQSKKAP